MLVNNTRLNIFLEIVMKKTIRDIDVQGKRVFVRVDYNVPINTELKIVSKSSIQADLCKMLRKSLWQKM